MSTNLIVRLWLRFAKWPGMTRTKIENTSLSAHIIPCQDIIYNRTGIAFLKTVDNPNNVVYDE